MGYHNANVSVIFARRACIGEFEIAHANRHQITGQRFCLSKLYFPHAVSLRGFGDDRRIGQGYIVLLYVERHLPRDFVARLIKAGESSSRADVFKLRVDVPIVPVLDLENSLHVLAVDFARKGGVQRRRTRTYRTIEGKAGIIFWRGDHLHPNRLSSHG